MAAAQEGQEEYANRHRQAAPAYQVGQKVWLDLRNIKTNRPSKKLDARHAKFTVLEKIGSHAYRLDTPPGIHNVFHTYLLRPAADDPFPSQKQTDWQPPAIINDEGEEEWEVERIPSHPYLLFINIRLSIISFINLYLELFPVSFETYTKSLTLEARSSASKCSIHFISFIFWGGWVFLPVSFTFLPLIRGACTKHKE